VHVPYTQLLDAAGRPKPAGELWTLLDKAGVPRYAPIVTVADDPGEAAVAWIVLRLMGYADVKVMLP
jgi:3-mercaptopyruvate sulfurtransferase SseA